jgi:hypothetical protein
MAVSVILLVSGQQRRTEFQTTVREFQLGLQDLANDVSSGFFSLPSDATDGRCRANPSGVHFDSSSSDSAECILIGRAIQLKNDNDGTYSFYTVVGKKENNSGISVSDLAEASPKVMDGQGNTPNSKLDRASTGAASADVGSIGFFTTFHRSTARGLTAGSTRVNIVPITTTTLSESDSSVISKIEDSANLNVKNPDGGIKICLESNGTDQHAIVSLGADRAGSLTVNSEIIGEATCPSSLF